MRIAINGMGRIGRLLFRRLIDHPAFDVVAINDIMPPQNLAYLIRHDSVYGNLSYPLVFDKNIFANGKEIATFDEADPAKLPWKELNVDIVLECTGKFTTVQAASQHLQSGAKKVLLSSTGAGDIPLLIYGYNQHALTADMNIISPGGCMTNCSVHPLYLLNSIGIESVQIHVIHSYTSRQELVDAPHKDFRRGRAAAESIIPVPVDLAQSLERILPALKNKISAMTTRVPVANGAFADFTLQMKEEVSAEQVNDIFRKAAGGEYRTILEYSEEPLVSSDIKGNIHSAVIAGDLTSVTGRQVKLLAFFDNEYGYTSRVMDWMIYWKKFL